MEKCAGLKAKKKKKGEIVINLGRDSGFNIPHTYFTYADPPYAARTYFNNIIGLGMYVVQGVSLGQSGRMSPVRRH